MSRNEGRCVMRSKWAQLFFYTYIYNKLNDKTITRYRMLDVPENSYFFPIYLRVTPQVK